MGKEGFKIWPISCRADITVQNLKTVMLLLRFNESLVGN